MLQKRRLMIKLKVSREILKTLKCPLKKQKVRRKQKITKLQL